MEIEERATDGFGRKKPATAFDTGDCPNALPIAMWTFGIVLLVILVCDGVRYFRVKRALDRGASAAAESLHSQPDLLRAFASNRWAIAERDWLALKDFERQVVAAGRNAAIAAGGVAAAGIASRAQLVSFTTRSPYSEKADRITWGAALVGPGECAQGREISLASCPSKGPAEAPRRADERSVTVLMAARFTTLTPFLRPIALQSMREVRAR